MGQKYVKLTLRVLYETWKVWVAYARRGKVAGRCGPGEIGAAADAVTKIASDAVLQKDAAAIDMARETDAELIEGGFRITDRPWRTGEIRTVTPARKGKAERTERDSEDDR